MRAISSVAFVVVLSLSAGVALTCLRVESHEAIFAATHGASTEYRGRVVYVDDGDTVIVRKESGEQVNVRLASIDAPELSHTRQEAGRLGQPYAYEAKRYLVSLVKGKVLDLKCPDADRYGRSVCDLIVDGRSIDQEMVRQGWAWANEAAHGRYMRDPEMPGLEAEARRERRGLWAGENPVPPWEWRSRCWEQGVCPN